MNLLSALNLSFILPASSSWRALILSSRDMVHVGPSSCGYRQAGRQAGRHKTRSECTVKRQKATVYVYDCG